MWRIAAGVLVLWVVAVACSGGDDAGTTTQPSDLATTVAPTTRPSDAQRQPEGASSFFSIEEVVLGPDGHVALHNFTDVPVTLDGLHLCQQQDCQALPDRVVEPGATAYVSPGDGGGDGVVVSGATIGQLQPADGELALYVTNPSDAANLLAYLEWGSTPHDRTAEAIARGLWLEGSFAPSGDDAVRLYRNAESGLWLWDAA